MQILLTIGTRVRLAYAGEKAFPFENGIGTITHVVSDGYGILWAADPHQDSLEYNFEDITSVE